MTLLLNKPEPEVSQCFDGPALTPEIRAEQMAINRWLRRRHLTLAEAVDRELDGPPGLVVLSLPKLARARARASF